MKNDKASNVIVCDECGFEWPYGETNLIETRWKDNKGELFVLLSFNCTQCGKQYIVCVDNEITLSERDEVIKLQKAIQRSLNTKGSNAIIYRGLVSKKERLLARLTKHQNQLKEAYLERAEKGLLEENKMCRCDGDVK